jgi:hypothetical protein
VAVPRVMMGGLDRDSRAEMSHRVPRMRMCGRVCGDDRVVVLMLGDESIHDRRLVRDHRHRGQDRPLFEALAEGTKTHGQASASGSSVSYRDGTTGEIAKVQVHEVSPLFVSSDRIDARSTGARTKNPP